MFKIDIHTHILPPEIPKFKERFGYGGFIQLQEHADCCGADMVDDSGNFFRRIHRNCYQADARIEDMNEYDLNVQVLSTVPVMFSYWTKPADGEYVSSFLNDHIQGVCEKHPKRFIPLGTLPLQSPKRAIKEIERLKKMNVPGVEIGSHINNWNLNAVELHDVYAALEENNMAVFVHPWEMMGKDQMSEYWLPWLVGMPAETSRAICSMIFGGIFKKFPKLKVAFAHGGGSFPMTIGRVEHGFNVRPDLCAKDNSVNPKEYLGHFWVDTLVHDPEVLRYLIQLMGEDKVALGTDYPFPLGEHIPGKIVNDLEINNNIKEKIMALNALEWLGLKLEDYKG
ncbi:MAG: 2-amino-3-carboxymuconate-6-semialdehyde decarboxylase [Halobacteriovoraceae bacterium]|nr:2-amino-3-carboxymuconate-6-semialdehyde decarboxylase [Halobacteriovoraceae bacterium]|tara:strand:+ start:9164 stop:10180 length:1017 start_codon:yes stop_codon:yes gene_type:complete